MGAGKTSIRIFQPTKSDSGQVRVRAENIHGYVEATSNLSVDVKPGNSIWIWYEYKIQCKNKNIIVE